MEKIRMSKLKVKKPKINKKSIIFIVIILLLTIIGGTAAYMMSRADFTNSFQGLKFNVDLEEEFYGTWGTKRVVIKNREEDNISVLLRISYNERWDHNGKLLSNTFLGEDIVEKYKPGSFSTDFECREDGWCYYTKEFKGGDEVEVLSAIGLNTELLRRSPDLEEYLASDYSLIVNYEVIAYDQELARDKWKQGIIIEGSSVIILPDPD